MPDAAHYQLGELFRYTGQSEAAMDQYRRTLSIDPEHPQAPGRIAQLSTE